MEETATAPVGDTPKTSRRFALRGRRAEGMVENRPVLDFITHAVLILGVAIIAFPVYVTFVASTITAEEVLAAPMPLVPGPHLIEARAVDKAGEIQPEEPAAPAPNGAQGYHRIRLHVTAP